MSKSVIQFQHEELITDIVSEEVYSSPFTFSKEDYDIYIAGAPQSGDLLHRIKRAIELKGYKFRQVDWIKRKVYYNKT